MRLAWIGLSVSLFVPISIAACGGTVLIDPPTPSGSSTDSTTVTSSSSFGTDVCAGSGMGNGGQGNGGAGSGGAGTGASGFGGSGSGGGGTGGGFSVTATSASVGVGGGTTAGPCPVAQPQAGAGCSSSFNDLECSYGDSVNPACRLTYTCSSNTWIAGDSSDCTGAPPPPAMPLVCPVNEPKAGAVCGETSGACTYDDDICYCGCGGGPECGVPYQWICVPPPSTPECPPLAPNSGTSCPQAAEGTTCEYGIGCTETSAEATCVNGFWQWGPKVLCG